MKKRGKESLDPWRISLSHQHSDLNSLFHPCLLDFSWIDSNNDNYVASVFGSVCCNGYFTGLCSCVMNLGLFGFRFIYIYVHLCLAVDI